MNNYQRNEDGALISQNQENLRLRQMIVKLNQRISILDAKIEKLSKVVSFLSNK